MSEYLIYADSACDIKPEMLGEWGVPYQCLTFRFDGDETEYSSDDMNIGEFYQKMREGGVAKTSAVNVENFYLGFETVLKSGRDLLYLGFSSGLSTTYNSARLAAERLREAYPDRKVIAVDTLAASAGYGLLVRLALDRQASGATVEEVAAYIEEIKLSLCHWFTVDDLVYLKRGGRISPTAAFVGNMLGIKPVLHVDDEGHLINVAKVRGRKTAVAALAAKYSETALTPSEGLVYISHGDCEDDARMLADMLREKHGVEVSLITDVGSVIGAHSGPGTLALFFIGSKR